LVFFVLLQASKSIAYTEFADLYAGIWIISGNISVFCRQKLIFCRQNFSFCRQKLVFCRQILSFCRQKLVFCRQIFGFCRQKAVCCRQHSGFAGKKWFVAGKIPVLPAEI
jgi:hypothetical protein